jgi:hypothetical protein
VMREFIALLTTFGIVFLVTAAIGIPVWLADRSSAMWESVTMTDRVLIPWTKKTNPLWWLVGPDGWEVPEINNGEPYLPEVKNIWLRRFYWFFCRNPMMNFVGFVIGVEDRNYTVTGTAPVLRTTGRDCDPQQFGFRWAVLKVGKWVRLPYVSYWNGKVEFYLGWRPHSGGFGLKFVVTSKSN